MKTLAILLALSFATVSIAADRPEYRESFDPAKGFKPAQRDLTEIYLQLAGSLEAYGSPEPYLRHVAAENTRIEELYKQKFGKPPKSFRPDYMTDTYIDRIAANWKLLSPKIGLEPWAKEFGNDMREAIKGTRGTGTIVVDIFNRHQEKVLQDFTRKSKQAAKFETLQAELVKQLELDKPTIDMTRYEVARRDAVSYGMVLNGITEKLFARIDQGLKPDAANSVKAVLKGFVVDTGRMAQSELEAGIAEWAIVNPSTAAR